MGDQNAVAVITGASRGIGLAMVRRLLEMDRVTRVYACARGARQGGELALLAEQAGERLIRLDVDITREKDIEHLAERIGREEPCVHWLINCAGMLHDAGRGMHPEKRIEDVDTESLEALFRLNAFAPVLLARYFLPLLRHQDKAVFASLSARVGSIADNHIGGWYGYRASKAAQNQFLRTFSIEAARRAPNLVCLALHPGTTDTRLSAPFQSRVPEGRLFSADYVAECLLDRVLLCTTSQSGSFMAWDGRGIPW